MARESKPPRIAKRQAVEGASVHRDGGAPARSAKRAAARKPATTAADRRRVVSELRALAHPLRLKLFELFAEAPRTTMQVAAILGEPPTRLYHHVNALEKSGLLRLKETKPIRGTVEKYYEAVIQSQKATVEALRNSPEARQSARAAVGVVFEQAKQDLNASLGDLPVDTAAAPMALRMLLGATPAKAAAIRKRLFALVNELRKECGVSSEGSAESGNVETTAQRRKPAPGEERWALTLAFAPSWPRRKSEG